MRLAPAHLLIDRSIAFVMLQLHSGAHKQTNTDRKAERLLMQLEAEGRPGLLRSKQSESTVTTEERKRFVDRIEEASAVIAERDHTIQQLEQKLRAALHQVTRFVSSNSTPFINFPAITQKGRAETRCGEALQEMEAMKSDILLLRQQLLVKTWWLPISNLHKHEH